VLSFDEKCWKRLGRFAGQTTARLEDGPLRDPKAKRFGALGLTAKPLFRGRAANRKSKRRKIAFCAALAVIFEKWRRLDRLVLGSANRTWSTNRPIRAYILPSVLCITVAFGPANLNNFCRIRRSLLSGFHVGLDRTSALLLGTFSEWRHHR
jgi:hypothetical protein